ncbi:MAG: hypothetical protein AB1664_00725 [Thermodesulfobacteriota bacterium]
MMTEDVLVQNILHHPVMFDKRYKDKPDIGEPQVRGLIASAIDRVVMAYEWDFALSSKDEAIVSGQSDYILRGNANDCRHVFNVRYGSGTADEGYVLLDKRTKTSIDAYLDNRTVYGVFAWTVIGRSGKFPQIRIIDTPTDTSKVLRYRYWVNNLNYQALPDGCNFDLLVMDAVLEELIPELKELGRFERRLREVKLAYEPPGGEDDPMVLDPYTRLRNNQRNMRHGYGQSDVRVYSDD